MELDDCPFRERPVIKYLYHARPSLTSCPTCGRCQVRDKFYDIVHEVQDALSHINSPAHVAVMGCMPPGSPILGQDLKPIETVKVGDEVLTHTGEFREVTHCFRRRYKGELVRIQPRGFPQFLVTPEHPIRIVPRRFLTRRKLAAASRAIKDGASWREAEWIPKACMLTYPIIKGAKDVKEITIEGLPVIKVDKDFLRVSGFYIAEGNTEGRNGKPYAQRFSFHIKEMPYYMDVIGILSKYGIRASLYPNPAKKGAAVKAHDIKLGEVFDDLFGRGAENKHLPSWMMTLPRRKQVHLIKALWEGDGSVCQIRKKYWKADYSTISATLAFQVHQLLLRQGIISWFSRSPARPGHQESWQVCVTGKDPVERLGTILGIELNLGDQFQPLHLAIDDDYLYAPIFKIDRIPYEGDVYNFEVADDHSYCVLGAATHNCRVNGPGEAKDADIGIACGKDRAALFEKGEIVKSLPLDEAVDEILARLPYIMVKDRGGPRISWRCWMDMEAECTFPDPMKPCHNYRVREDYVHACPHRKPEENNERTGFTTPITKDVKMRVE